jgi:hypothetical protein
LVEDLIGKGKSTEQQWLIPRAGKPAQFCLVGKNRVFCRRIRENDFGSGSSQPRPMLVGGDDGRMLAEKRQPDSGNRRDHRHAYLPRV